MYVSVECEWHSILTYTQFHTHSILTYTHLHLAWRSHLQGTRARNLALFKSTQADPFFFPDQNAVRDANWCTCEF